MKLIFFLFVCFFSSACALGLDESELKRDRKVRPFSMFEPTEAPATSLRKNQSSDDLVRDAQVRRNENTLSLTSLHEKKFSGDLFIARRNEPKLII